VYQFFLAVLTETVSRRYKGCSLTAGIQIQQGLLRCSQLNHFNLDLEHLAVDEVIEELRAVVRTARLEVVARAIETLVHTPDQICVSAP